MAKKTDDSALLKQARDMFEKCQSAENETREMALDDVRFAKLGEQWPDQVKKQREIERRPCLTINKLPSFIRQVVNDARQNKPSIKVRPVDSSGDRKTAEIVAGLIKNIEYTSNADVAYDTAIECAVTGGFGYFRVGLDYAYDNSFEMDLSIERVLNPFSVYGDPNSTAADSSDWDVAFIIDRIPRAEFKRKYGDKATVDFEASAWKDAGATWLTDETVLVAEYWTREEVTSTVVKTSDGKVFSQEQMETDPDLSAALEVGAIEIVGTRETKTHKVTQVIMSGIDVLETNDWPGRFIPIVPVYGDEFAIDGKRYFRSLINHAKDAQRMFNYWRSTSTELVALAPRVPFIGPKGAFDEDDGWDTANTSSHSYLEYSGPVSPQRQPLDTGPAGGALQEAMNASDDMKAIIGMYDASLGARSNETSGRAIMARQREGDVATFHFIDNLSRAIRHLGRVLIDLIPHVYSGPRVVRVIGEDGKETTAAINQQSPEVDKKGQPVVDEMGQAVMAMHDLTAGKYDLTVDSGPSFTSRREEAAMQMTEFLRAVPQAAMVLGGPMAKNMDWPGADEIAEKLEKMDPTNQPQIPPEMQQQMQQGQEMIQQLQQENAQLKQDQSADAAKLQQQEQTDMAKIASQERIAMAKMQSEQGLKTRQMMINGEAQEVEGPDGQMTVKTRADMGNEAIMQGLAMIAQSLQNVAQLIQQGDEGVMTAVLAPKQVMISRDATGRIDGAIQQTMVN